MKTEGSSGEPAPSLQSATLAELQAELERRIRDADPGTAANESRAPPQPLPNEEEQQRQPPHIEDTTAGTGDAPNPKKRPAATRAGANTDQRPRKNRTTGEDEKGEEKGHNTNDNHIDDDATGGGDGNDEDASAGRGRRRFAAARAPARSRKGTSSIRPPLVKKEDDGETHEEKMAAASDGPTGEPNGDAEESPRPSKRPRRSASRKAPPTTEGPSGGRGPVEERRCPHCRKVFSTRDAMRYHVDNFVCRIDECKDPDILAKAKRKPSAKTAEGSAARKHKRFRGSLSDRTCPLCDRVFTSVLGRNYHFQHRVCQQASASGGAQKDATILGLLPPGSRFVTQFGVVEVVRDDRAVPTAVRTPEQKRKVRQYQALKSKMEAFHAKAFDYAAVPLRARRSRIHEVFRTKEGADGNAFFRAYFEGRPRPMPKRSRRREEKEPLPPVPTDPMIPEESFPDRIVECLLVPDRRTRFSSDNIKNPTQIATANDQEEATNGRTPTRMFLRRRLLTEEYREEISVYVCADCGRGFNSNTGLKYHTTSRVCLKSNQTEDQKRRERKKAIQAGAEDLLNGKGRLVIEPPPKHPRRAPPRTASTENRKKKKKKKKREQGIYPEVLLSLGFKVVKKDLRITEDMVANFQKEVDQGLPGNHFNDPHREETVVGGLSKDKPESLLQHLKKEFEKEKGEFERKAADQKHGPMYAPVFKSLGFKKAKKKRQATAATTRVSKRRRRTVKPPPPPKPLPPIIDTRALADEVDAERYPSMKRNKEGNHADVCILCRQGGELICCDFCTNVEHMACIRKKFTVKDPEPEDDFMCHKCIQTILHRRNRAEKRRLRKQEREEERRERDALEEKKLNPGIQKGMEYPYMAARGQEVSELVELLYDAQTRLRQSLATSKMNDVRRRVMGCFYKKK